MSRDSALLVPIGDLATSEPGAFKIGPFGSSLKKSELVDRGIPVLGIENVLANQFEMGGKRFISPAKFEELADYAIRPGDILVTTMGTIGRAAVVPENRLTAIIDSHLFRMRVDARRILPRYLAYAINSGDLTRQLAKKSRGAIMDGLNTTILKECELRVPSLHKQEAMLSKLDTASRLSHKCRFSLDMSEDLFRAVFLEMFGDPVRNPMEWPLVELCDLLDRIDSGYSPVCEGPRGSVSEWAVLGLGAVTSGRLKTEENKLLPDQSKARIELEVKDRDVLVTRKNTADLVAACALVRKPPPKLLLPDTVFRFVPKAKSGLDVAYLWGLMSAPRFRKQKVQSLAAGSAGSMPGISKEKFLELSIPLPSLERQLKYDRVVDRHNQVRSVLEESLRQAEHLFQSLLHEAFGETRDTVRGDARRP